MQPAPTLRFAIPFLLGLMLLGVALATPCEGAVIELFDGTKVTGVITERQEDSLTIYLADGTLKSYRFEEILGVNLEAENDPELEKRAAAKVREQGKNRSREAEELLSHYAEASAEKRAEIANQLDQYTEPELLGGLSKAVRSKRAPLREFALARLSRAESKLAAVPLAMSSITVLDEEFSRRAFDSAAKKDGEFARRLCEYAAAKSNVEPECRLRALDHLQRLADPRSVPPLLVAAVYVTQDVRLQLVRDKGMREVPVNLGSLNQAASNVNIELPNTELIEVQTSAVVPAEVVEHVQKQVFQTLRSVSGKNFGDDVNAWTTWWEQDGKAELEKRLAERPAERLAEPKSK